MRKLLAAAATLAATLGGLSAAAPAMAAPACTAQIGGSCGGYADQAFWPGSNGFNTYVMDQAVDPQQGDTGSITATGPSSWTAQADYTSCGGCVQTFTAVQQLTNNWTGQGNGWQGPGPYSNTPLPALKTLQITYSESTPSGPGNQSEWAPDLWTNYGSDIMLWADTSTADATPGQPSSRCDDNGLSASNIIGQAKLGAQQWTVYSFGRSSEIIFVLDGTSSTDPVDTNTCAQQKAGTIHVLAALKWVSAHRSVTGAPPWADQFATQINTGWEITAGDGTGQYAVTRLAYKASRN